LIECTDTNLLRISGECRGFLLADPKTVASIATTAVADGNEVVETMAWHGLECGVTETA
jgi:hypothetical protein